MFSEMVFFLYKFIQANFLYCLRFFVLAKNIKNITARTPTKMKQNLFVALNFFSSRFSLALSSY